MKFKNFDKEKIIFCNVTWMKRYCGVTNQDRVHEGGAYPAETGDAAEAYNFYDYGDGYHYGYTPPPEKNILIEKLGTTKDASEISGITAIWTAKSPLGGKRVVGWYKNATVLREMPDINHEDYRYRLYAKIKNCCLIPADDRELFVPIGKGATGQSNITYGKFFDAVSHKTFLGNLDKLLGGHYNPAEDKTTTPTKLKRMVDVEKRQKIETAAIDCVWKFFEDRQWRVKTVEKENVGWDLTVTKKQEKLYVEVKGHAGNEIKCELTPNEYAKAKSKLNYRLAVVTDAISKKPCLRIFAPIHCEGKKPEWYCYFRQRHKG